MVGVKEVKFAHGSYYHSCLLLFLSLSVSLSLFLSLCISLIYTHTHKTFFSETTKNLPRFLSLFFCLSLLTSSNSFFSRETGNCIGVRRLMQKAPAPALEAKARSNKFFSPLFLPEFEIGPRAIWSELQRLKHFRTAI